MKLTVFLLTNHKNVIKLKNSKIWNKNVIKHLGFLSTANGFGNIKFVLPWFFYQQQMVLETLNLFCHSKAQYCKKSSTKY